MSKVNQTKKINYDDLEYRITPVQQAAASCTGAVITSLFVTPLDVVKIRLQAQQKEIKPSKCFLYCNGLMDHICKCAPEDINTWYQRPGHFNGTVDAFIKIGRTEGLTSLWSGLSPTLVLSIPATIAYFVTYEQLRLKLKDLYNANKPVNEPLKQPYWIPMLSGATARIISATTVSPLELIRTKMQSKKLSYYEIGEGLQLLIKQDGIKGLWKGILPTLLRDVPFSAVYWMHYESIKSFFLNSDTVPSFWFSFVAGAISGSIAATVTVPFDVVKTHQQIEFGETTLYSDQPGKSKTTMEIFRDIYRQHGVRGLFAGSVPRLIKVAPACAIMISSFEYGKVFFNSPAYKERIEITPYDRLATIEIVLANMPV
ncbi:solute carrier family 25 member 40 isoform X2 [Anoplophora glabripennis]|uniref:solute carrier family 25 member 40 isoform X2 n=1 Tax=Anoplophora glabripennis TaxID=217634 RepID=UPI000873A748|nr:solute carrier family 25 member 40 isoform X2 [Anoplophora glabripennis]